MKKISLSIVNNIPTPYRRELFDEIARQADAQGIDFTVLYLAGTEAVRDWTVELRSFETVLPVLCQKRNPRTPTSDFILNAGFAARALRSKHVILFGYNYPTYLAILFLRTVFRRSTHLFCESTLYDASMVAFKKVLKALLFRHAFDRFIVPGQCSAEYLAAHGVTQKNISIAHNASPMRPKHSVGTAPADELRVLFVGRLAPEKRILEFTQSFASLGAAYRLTIVGDGPMAPDILVIAEGHPRIDVLGAMDARALSSIYARHDVLVLVSDSETWGLVVNEAINHGLALILSPQVGSAPELLDGNGVYLSEISPGRIAAALDKVSKNQSVYRARSIEIAKSTTVERQADAFLAIANRGADANK
jgi:glycosyltransferase involved in cell wall biosynthesis